MFLRSIVRKSRVKYEGTGKESRRPSERKRVLSCGGSHIVPERSPPCPSEYAQQSRWANLPPELLLEIVRRVEAGETSWPGRRIVVAWAAICKSWREIVKEVIRTPEQCGLLTFPISLKQPGPRDAPIQCFIKRDKKTSIYRLYLDLSPALSREASKLLLEAKKVKRVTKTEFLLSLASNDFSRSSDKYVGNLRSNFFGTKFSIYDLWPSCNSTIKSNGLSCSNTVSTKLSLRSRVATISYELNVLRTKGPRRMLCTAHRIPGSAIQDGGNAPTPATFPSGSDYKLSISEGRTQESTSGLLEQPDVIENIKKPLILRNKSPRWHEHLQCWCLNFKGRVTVASVKNFQLVAAADSLQNVPSAEHERVILQFGKIGKDIFTMDYCYPLCAFQAFGICLSSFDTKPACE